MTGKQKARIFSSTARLVYEKKYEEDEVPIAWESEFGNQNGSKKNIIEKELLRFDIRSFQFFSSFIYCLSTSFPSA